MATLPKNGRLDTLLALRVPKHFHKSIKREAKKLGLTLSDYCTTTLINEMRTGTVKKEVEERIASGNMYWATYPIGEEIYQFTPEENKFL